MKTKIIDLPCGVQLTVVVSSPRGGTAITCSETEPCPGCGDPYCYFDCDGSHTIDEEFAETEDDAKERIEWNCRIEGMLSLIQNLYSTGFDHLIEEMGPAIENTMQDIGNQI